MSTAQSCATSAPSVTRSQIQANFEGVEQLLRRNAGDAPAKPPAKIPYAGKETPEETAALKAAAEPKPAKNTTVVLPIAGSAAALRKALKGSPAPKVAKAKPAKAPKVAKSAAAKPKPAGGKSKLEIVAALLLHKGGTTNAEILAATQWPSVSVPQMAKAAGLKLRKEKVKGKPTRYYGSK